MLKVVSICIDAFLTSSDKISIHTLKFIKNPRERYIVFQLVYSVRIIQRQRKLTAHGNHHAWPWGVFLKRFSKANWLLKQNAIRSADCKMMDSCWVILKHGWQHVGRLYYCCSACLLFIARPQGEANTLYCFVCFMSYSIWIHTFILCHIIKAFTREYSSFILSQTYISM